MSSCRFNAWIKFGDLLVVLLLCVTASKSAAGNEDIRGIADRLVAAEKIQRTYVEPLDLKGKSGAAAVEKMLAEGFRCRIEIAGEYVPGARPMWYCTKSHAELASVCNDLRVALRFGPPAETFGTHSELLLKLDQIEVASSHASCPPPLTVSTADVAAKSTGGKFLAEALNALDLKDKGDIAYGRLLRDGFYCEFVVSEDSRNGPRMECTKIPSKIKFCHEAKVTMELSWPDGVRTLQHAYRQLPNSRVTSTRAACEVPAAQSGLAPDRL